MDLRTLISGDEPPGLRRGLVTVAPNVPMHAGTSVRVPHVPFVGVGGIWRPTSTARGPLDFAGTYITLVDYLGLSSSGRDTEEAARAVALQAVRSAPRSELLGALSVLLANTGPGGSSQLVDDFVSGLPPEVGQRLRHRLRHSDEPRVLLVRQLLLLAARYVILHGVDDTPVTAPPFVTGIILSHALGDLVSIDEPNADRLIAGLPEQLGVDLTCNMVFNASDDLHAELDRTLRLWRDYGHLSCSRFAGRSAAQLLNEAIGASIEDMLALGLALAAYFQTLAPGTPPYVVNTLGSDMSPAVVRAFVRYVSEPIDALANALAAQTLEWDFRTFERKPVAEVSSLGLLVIDGRFLLGKITTGLYWAVHDHLKDSAGEKARLQWTQVYGDMVEAMAEASLVCHAPPLLGGGKTHFTEDEFAAAYPESKRPDLTIDVGDVIVVAEVVSGRLKNDTRHLSQVAAFWDDMEKIVYKKLRQLDDATRQLVTNPAALTGVAAVRPVRPVIVAGEGFPHSPVTVDVMRRYCRDNALLEHAIIREPVLIDLGELELLEALRERGHGLANVLDAWQRSSIAAMPLKNFVLTNYPEYGAVDLRPGRIRDRIAGFFEDAVARLKLAA